MTSDPSDEAMRAETGSPPDARDGTGRTRVGNIELRAHNCFACGQLNLTGLRMQLHVDGDRCWSELALPQRFEGWEGTAHGGILSAIADEVMAWSLFTRDAVGVTARLAVRFRQPVAIGQTIRAEGWISEQRRQRFDTQARIIDVQSGDVLLEASAVYIAPSAERARELKARYELRAVPTPDSAGATSGGGGGSPAGAVGLAAGGAA